jgi:hypothetical protein
MNYAKLLPLCIFAASYGYDNGLKENPDTGEDEGETVPNGALPTSAPSNDINVSINGGNYILDLENGNEPHQNIELNEGSLLIKSETPLEMAIAGYPNIQLKTSGTFVLKKKE